MPAHAVPGSEEARAEHVVGPAARDRFEDACEVSGIVLAVAVEVDGGRVPLVAGYLEPAAKSGAEPARGLMRVDAGAMRARNPRGAVARPVIDQESIDRKPARLARDPAEHRANRGFLIAGNDDCEAATLVSGGVRFAEEAIPFTAAVRRRREHRGILHRHQRRPARGLRRR
jgi:hypothetical protein